MSNYKGGGRLTTQLNGVLSVYHGDGIIEFRLRSAEAIRKRGTRVILRIEGLPEIARLENGRAIVIDVTAASQGNPAVYMGEVKDNEDDRDRHRDSEGVAR